MAAIQSAYASSGNTVALTLTLASLATSSTRLVGRASTVVSNLSNLDQDHIIQGLITTGTSPTAGLIDIWVYKPIQIVSGTATYPDSITGTDAAKTFASVEVQYAAMVKACTIATNATSNIGYSVAGFSVAALFGGSMPESYGLFVSHSTAVNLHATAGNHYLNYSRIWSTST